jgi:hypothetical protein
MFILISPDKLGSLHRPASRKADQPAHDNPNIFSHILFYSV